MKTILFVCLSFVSAITRAGAEDRKLVIIGDSLTEGYGVAQAQAYPALLQRIIRDKGKAWRVVNSGLSGSTAASAPSRVSWALKQKPDLLLLALGANDGLRGTPTKDLEANLAKAIESAHEAKVKLILVGMQMPPNYGKAYAKEFRELYPRLAKQHHVPLIPFLLEGVAGQIELNQSDGIHPNAKGHEIVAKNMFKALEKDL